MSAGANPAASKTTGAAKVVAGHATVAVAAAMNSHPNAPFIQVRGLSFSHISRSIDGAPSCRVSEWMDRKLTEPTTELLGHHLLRVFLGRFARSPLGGSDSEARAVPT